jgi:hypothetical protein
MSNFDQYKYYPSLRTRLWELRGYRELGAEDKTKLLPIMVLTRHHQQTLVSPVGDIIQGALEERPFILDLEMSPLLACEDHAALCNPTNSFAAWRSFAERFEHAIPTALLPAGAPPRDVVQQVRKLEEAVGKVAVRSRAPAGEMGLLSSILNAVDSVDNLLIVLDFGYVRSRVPAVVVEAAEAINSLRAIDPTVRIVVMGSSYPKSAAAYDDAGAVLEIQERTLHGAIGGDTVAIYGDHAAVYPEPFEPMQSRFVPRVDYALPDSWIFRRVRADMGGFTECARQIVALADWDPELVVRGAWGAAKIEAVSRGDTTSMGSPGPWISVRVNLHLWQQLNGIIHSSDDGEDVFD